MLQVHPTQDATEFDILRRRYNDCKRQNVKQYSNVESAMHERPETYVRNKCTTARYEQGTVYDSQNAATVPKSIERTNE